jgi:uncharacterized protein involved in exopolysaccharide biosynthesis
MEEKQIEISPFFKLIKILYKYRKPFIVFNLTVFILSIIIAFLLPKWYRGSITFIVNENDQSSIIASITGNLPLDFLGGSNQKVSQYMNFITSRRILDNLDSLYNLQEVYEIVYRQQFYKALKSNIIIMDNDDNTISVDFYYKDDPVLAAKIANSIYEQLYNLSLELNQDRNKKLSIFLENSYELTIKKIKAAEEKLTNYQVKNQIFDVEIQLEMLIKKIAELEIEKIQLEIEMKYFEKNLSKYDQNVKALKNRIDVIAAKIHELKYSSTISEIALSQMPVKVVKYLELYRDVEILNKVLEFLVPQLENARLQEIKTDANIQLLDKAVPEDYKSKPKRLNIIFAATFLALITSIFILLLLDYKKRNLHLIKEVLGK